MTKKTTFPVEYGPLDETELIKESSHLLRGNLAEEMENPISAGIAEADGKLMKFHGSYVQDDRDVRDERRRKKLEPAYQFMIRLRAPGGVFTPEQWLKLDEIAHQYANGTLRLTTRQTFQFHGILKWNVKKTIQAMNEALLDSIAACGDVNRNVMSTANPYLSHIHGEVYEWSKKISEHLLPQTKAYHEIWLDGEKVVDSGKKEEEPMYGSLYLPRKFKIGVAIPPSNDVDVYSQDIGFIAIVERDKLVGFNVAVGGGLGMTHGNTETYPQLSKVIGFCKPEQVMDVAEKIVTIQRDYGNRSDRKNARFKYTIDRYGIEWFKEELTHRLGDALEDVRPYEFESNGDRYGWVKGANNRWHYTLFVQNGRIKDTDNYKLMTALREIARTHKGEFRATPNQNLIISNVTNDKKKQIEKIITDYNLTDANEYSALHRNSIACVALPTCGLAMAEAERYLPTLLDKIEAILDKNGLRDEDIVIRMSGCPNGCSRAALAEIGFIGKAPGKYNMYLGAGFAGQRLNKMYRENIGEEEILNELEPIIADYAKTREEGEHFGDFVIRKSYVNETTDGQNFHDEL